MMEVAFASLRFPILKETLAKSCLYAQIFCEMNIEVQYHGYPKKMANIERSFDFIITRCTVLFCDRSTDMGCDDFYSGVESM